MVALLKSRPRPAQRPRATPQGIFQTTIEGRYRPVTVHQLAIAWWLYNEGHISRRQLRVYFAAHEMHEKRRYTKTEPGQPTRRAMYTLDEIKALIGSADSTTADAALSADVKALGRLGLVQISTRSIEFAVSIDQIAIDDVSGFWAFFEQLPNNRRRVPMPRRTLRALAKGFTKGVTGMMLALLIRSLFWHRPGGRAGEQGGYRVDGRTKCSWIAEVFGISTRTLTDARARLIEMGWLVELVSQQWELNRYGPRYTINANAFAPVKRGTGQQGETASPCGQNPAVSASPCLNTSTSSTKKDLKTRKPAPVRSEPAEGSRKRKSIDRMRPRLTNIRHEDLVDTGRLLDLHHQAVQRGDPVNGEGGRHDFVALAERARRHGNDPARMFAWLLREKRFDFITHEDEDAAAIRLREMRDGPRGRAGGDDQEPSVRKPAPIALTEDDKIVLACLQTAQKHRQVEPFTLARQVKGWTRDQWDVAFAAYKQKQHERWSV